MEIKQNAGNSTLCVEESDIFLGSLIIQGPMYEIEKASLRIISKNRWVQLFHN